jgi:hypothetical protein
MSGGSSYSPSYAITAPVWHPGVTCCWRLGSRAVNHVTLHCPISNNILFCISQIRLSSIHLSMALQPFLGPWPLQFRNHFIQAIGLLGRVISPSERITITVSKLYSEWRKQSSGMWRRVDIMLTTSQKTAFLIVTAVKSSNVIYSEW